MVDLKAKEKAVEAIWCWHRRFNLGPSRGELEQAYDAGWMDRNAVDENPTNDKSASDNENTTRSA